ncbi:DUF6550 family protein [Enterocloster clostridioformis]|uniref:DUF6550 family protein n=1 Tax=Enterocloster clostridioformis TaxID=1531 RepID=UPI0008DED78D|nr:DUF6550 family protein [Enterocloster clostridioformis]SFG53701.1 hypothetical protein SAMN05660211_03173 [Enterocloster clostridioformis]
MAFTEKTKRYLAIGGGVAACAVLVAAISLQFGRAPAKEDVLPTDSPQVTELVIDPSGLQTGGADQEKEPPAETQTEKETEPQLETQELVIKPNIDPEKTDQLVDARSAQTDQSEQSIQPEPTKPETPEKGRLTDPTVKPNGEKVEGTPVPVEHEHVERPVETEPSPDTPQAGDTSGNQIYIPGFGWVENHGGGGSGTVAEDMYENGNKIGIMD